MRLTGTLTEILTAPTEEEEAVPWWRQNLPLLAVVGVVALVGLYELKKGGRR